MERHTRSGLAFVGMAAALLTISLVVFGDDATRLGRDNLRHRAAVREALAAPVSQRPVIVFMGDSTIYDASAYPTRIAKMLGGAVDVRSVRQPGFDFYHYYFSLGEVLELEPALIVFVAHLRMFGREGYFGMMDLMSMLPTSELPRAVLLPLHERGITLPELIASRVLRPAWGEQALELDLGLRAALQAAPGWRWLVPAVPPLDVRNPALRHAHFSLYDTPIYEAQPVVRMMAAALELAIRRGAAVIVVASPIPVTELAREGLYDWERYMARIEILRRITEAEGGELLDLHPLLPSRSFSDELGHTQPEGSQRIAVALVGPVRAALARRGYQTGSAAAGR